MVMNYYQNIFKQDDLEAKEFTTPSKFPAFSNEQNHLDHKQICKEEIKTAVFDMAPFKSPRAYGFHAGFFQHTWPIVGDLFCRYVTDFSNSGIL